MTSPASRGCRNASSRDATGHDAYFLENTFPGDEKGAIKPAGRLITSEGALSAFFHRWATNDALKQRDRDAAFYDLFGTTAVEVTTPLQNVYLKLFHAMERRRPRDARALVAAYRELFPDEAALLDSVVADVFHVRTLNVPSELWLANAELRTGTTMGVIVSWVSGSIVIAIGAVIVLFGIPSALWQT